MSDRSHRDASDEHETTQRKHSPEARDTRVGFEAREAGASATEADQNMAEEKTGYERYVGSSLTDGEIAFLKSFNL